MRSSIVALLLSLLVAALGVNAHFQLQFPPPRGPFVAAQEPTFCDGYNTPASNRTKFPLTGGFFTFDSEHPEWTAGVLVSTAANPASFNNFSQVNSFFQMDGEGLFCIPLDFSKSNVTGLESGQNVTVQIVYDGGDGELFQCADLTLENGISISSSVTCSNATGTNAPAGIGGSRPGLAGDNAQMSAVLMTLAVIGILYA